MQNTDLYRLTVQLTSLQVTGSSLGDGTFFKLKRNQPVNLKRYWPLARPALQAEVGFMELTLANNANDWSVTLPFSCQTVFLTALRPSYLSFRSTLNNSLGGSTSARTNKQSRNTKSSRFDRLVFDQSANRASPSVAMLFTKVRKKNSARALSPSRHPHISSPGSTANELSNLTVLFHHVLTAWLLLIYSNICIQPNDRKYFTLKQINTTRIIDTEDITRDLCVCVVVFGMTEEFGLIFCRNINNCKWHDLYYYLILAPESKPTFFIFVAILFIHGTFYLIYFFRLKIT